MNQYPPTRTTRHPAPSTRRRVRPDRTIRRGALAVASLAAIAGTAGMAAGPAAASPTPAAPADGWTSDDGVQWEHTDGRVIVVAWPRTTN